MRNEKAADVLHANDLLDKIVRDLGLRNDAALSRALEVSPSMICKIRSGTTPFTDLMLIIVHEATGLSIKELKAILRDGLPFHVQLLTQQASNRNAP